MPEAPELRKLEALDGIRGLAVLAVMAHHFEPLLPAVGAFTQLKRLLYFGWAGVDVFFVLSGFLITGVLLAARGAVNYYASFYARRVLRIAPIYYLTLGVVFGLAAFWTAPIPGMPAAAERPFYFAYAMNWLPVWTHAWPSTIVGHFWSLAVEEQFYLVWPVVVLLLSPHRLKRLTLALCAIELALRAGMMIANVPLPVVYCSILTHSDGLLLGAFCAVIYRERRDLAALRLNLWMLVPMVLFLAGLVSVRNSDLHQKQFTFSAGLTLIAVGAAAFVLKAAAGDGTASRLQRFLRASSLRRVGRYSYGMYVYHLPIFALCQLALIPRLAPGLAANPAVGALLLTALGLLTFLVAALSYECFERPILALKRYVKPRFDPAAGEQPAYRLARG